MTNYEILLQKNSNGKGAKPRVSVRAPKAYKQAIEALAAQRQTTASKLVIESSLRGDQELRQLMKRLSRGPLTD